MFKRNLIQVMSLWLATTTLACAKDVSVVYVKLNSVVESVGEVVSISDVASITGGSVLTRRKVSQLDLAKAGDRDANRISKQQVEFRIRLAGFGQDKVQVIGAERIRIKAAVVPDETRLLSKLSIQLAEGMGISEKDIQLRLTRPLRGDERLFEPGVRIEFLLPASTRLGPQTVRIAKYYRSRLVKTIPLGVDVRVMRDVAVALRTLPSGEVIRPGDVKVEKRAVGDGRTNQLPQVVIGKTTRRSIRQGAIVSATDLQSPRRVRKQVVIRNRDLVEIVARRRSLRVTISGGMALQQGAVGDSIRVKNPSSGQVLTATVVDTGRVEIRL